MIGFLVGWWRARAARPLLWWVLGLLAYATLPLPQEWVLLLIVGLGVALTVTIGRLRHGGHQPQHGERAWELAERLGDAVEDRIRGGHNQPGQALPTAPQGYVLDAPPTPGAGVVYDPGALLTTVVAVLAAEGLPASARPGLPACAQLLTWQRIGLAPGAPAPTAHRLAAALAPGAPRRYRVMPPVLLAAVICVVLTEDRVLPAQITTDDDEALIAASQMILHALGVQPADDAGSLLLADELTPRYTPPLPHLARVRLLSGAQLDRLLADPELSGESVGRVRRRIMGRLAQLGLVAMLGRRIGGVRAGSAGHVYTLTTAGHRFLALVNNAPPPARKQPSHTPGDLFLTHTLSISGIYVGLIERSRGGGFHVHSFVSEPHCWHPVGGGAYLRPDAYVIARTGALGHCWWLEIDTGTETIPRLRAKIRTYRDFLTSGGVGPDGAPPRVLFTTPDQQRADAITGLLGATDDVITATTHDRAAAFMIDELHAP